MKPNHVIALVLALIVRAPVAGSEAASAWQGSDIGGGQSTGSHTWNGRTLTVTGAGAGLNVKNADQLHFVHVGRPAGDFEVVVRLVDFSGEGDARAGIMARADGGASAAMATLSFQVKDNGLGWMSRIASDGTCYTSSYWDEGVGCPESPEPGRRRPRGCSQAGSTWRTSRRFGCAWFGCATTSLSTNRGMAVSGR